MVSTRCPVTLSLFLLASVAVSSASQATFIYRNAPIELIMGARQIGENERLSYLQAVESAHSDDEKMQLYADHFSACSHVASDISKRLFQDTNKTSSALDVLQTIGVDRVSGQLMTMPVLEVAETVHEACLKHELQFQCAYGFLGDANKIVDHLQVMMAGDGNLKMLFSTACRRPEEAPLTYSCVGENAGAWMRECGASIAAYNITRTEVNVRMGTGYAEAISEIEGTMAHATSPAELDLVMAKSTELMTRVLAILARLEAFKCRSYYQMERCLVKAVTTRCGPEATTALQTVLRVGYLRRERGDDLHSQFLELGVPVNAACAKTFST